MLQFSPENILLIGSVLIFTAILISRAGFKFGIPVLLLFIVVGMAFGVDGLGLSFDNFHIAQFIGTIALCVILYCGGLETKFDTIKPVLKEGIVLSSVGVFLTALFTGGFIYLLTRVGHLSACGRDVVNRLSVSVQHPEERKDEAEGEPAARP